MFTLSRYAAFVESDGGQGLVEYALIIALVSIVAIAGLTFFGQKTNNELHAAQIPLGD